MDSGVSAHTLILVCWPTLVLLGVFAILFFPLRRDAFFGSGQRHAGGPMQNRNFIGVTKLLLLGALLLGAVFLIPDSGQLQHRSFISVAQDSPWSHLFDWPAAWCSAKIIGLSVSAILILEAILKAMMHSAHQTACMVLLVLAIVPMLLGFFGLYEFVKAVL